MGILLTALAVAFAAFCIWLGVRIVNRGERWAKWTLAGTIIGVPILYALGFGPICWLYHSDWDLDDDTVALIQQVYSPILWLDEEGPKPMRDAIDWYAVSGTEAADFRRHVRRAVRRCTLPLFAAPVGGNSK